jgi:hypothetical protein
MVAITAVLADRGWDANMSRLKKKTLVFVAFGAVCSEENGQQPV